MFLPDSGTLLVFKYTYNYLLFVVLECGKLVRVFHIPTRFSFFASFFLFIRPPFFVDNSPGVQKPQG